jgi:hypothetical protein
VNTGETLQEICWVDAGAHHRDGSTDSTSYYERSEKGYEEKSNPRIPRIFREITEERKGQVRRKAESKHQSPKP